MTVLIVSDLHLGAPGRLTNADEALMGLLKQTQWDRVVFLGDIFELWHRSYAEIVDLHGKVLDTISALPGEVLYLPGNHDAEFVGLQRINNMTVIDRPYSFEDGGTYFSMTHGDEFDSFGGVSSKIGSWIGTIADTVASWFLGRGTSIQRFVRYSFAQTPQREKYAGPIADAAVAALEGDVAIIGHTHLPETRQYESKLYVNTGDFGPSHLSYVTIRNGVVQLRKV